MRQSYWHTIGNLWAVALSTAIALFLPEFGPKDLMSGGVGVVIRATMIVPFVFSLIFCIGWLIIHLTNKLKEWWAMSVLTAGMESAKREIARRRAKEAAEQAEKEAIKQAAKEAKEAKEAAEKAAREAIEAKLVIEQAAEQAAKAAIEQAAERAAAETRESERARFRQFMRVKGLTELEIDAFFRQEPVQD